MASSEISEAQSSETVEAESKKSSQGALDALYKHIMSPETEKDNTKLQKVLLSSSYPSRISLKLQGIQKMLKEHKGPLDTDSLNFAIRILRREETIDRSPDSEILVRKYYFSTDFVRLASEDGQSDLETCVRNGYVYHHHNAFGQVADLSCHYKKEVLFIPVHHDDGSWSLYGFNLSDQKLSIFDPTRECAFNMNHQKRGASLVLQWKDGENIKEHDEMRLKICKALRFVKDKFNLFKNTSGDFSSWRYEFTDLSQFKNTRSSICTREDSGFFVFYFMLFWDGHQLIDKENIPKEPKDLRKGFLKYIVSSNYNEVYFIKKNYNEVCHHLDDLGNLPDVFKLMKQLRSQKASAGCPALTRFKMDTTLLKEMTENNVDAIDKLLLDKQSSETRLQNFCLGATCDGDGVLHIAARYGDRELKLLCAILKQVAVELNLEAIKTRLLESTITVKMERHFHEEHVTTRKSGGTCYVTIHKRPELHQQNLVMLLRSINHKGETCLHEAVRRDNALLALSLILVDDEISDEDSSLPPLVQRVDYEGISPLYLAATLCRSDIVGILTHETNRYKASFSGPGGKTALHAAILLNKGLIEQLRNWMKHVKGIPDPTIMADNSGNTPLHLVSSAVEGADIAEVLLSSTPGDKEPLATSSAAAPKDSKGDTTYSAAALMKDSKGWLPIHVAAANGNLDVIKQLIDKCPECIESRNTRGQSFLHVAIEKKCRNVVRYVCSQQSLAGILNLTDQDGNTALHLAIESANQYMFCDLMRNPRVCLNSSNREGWTPLDVAKMSLGTELRLLMRSPKLIYYHLKWSGAHYGTCRRDVLDDDIAGKLDKEKISELISKSAGLWAVCAIFMLNLSVTTFFNVAKQHLAPTDPNTAAPPPSPLSAAQGSSRSASLRVNAFRFLIAADFITVASSLTAAFYCTLAGFPTAEVRIRFKYLNIAGLFVQVSCLGVVAIFILTAYLAFAPVNLQIGIVAFVLPISLFIQQFSPLFLHAWILSRRHFRKHTSLKILAFFETYFPAKKFTPITNLFRKFKEKMEPIRTCFLTKIKAIMKAIPIWCRYCILLLLVVVVGVMALRSIYGHISRHH